MLLTSNVAAAMLTYYLTYERPTSIGYSLSTSTISTKEMATSIPGLEIRIGDESRSEIHFHTVSLKVSGRYLPEVPIALEFQKAAPKIYNVGTNGPSTLFSARCPERTPLGIKCTLTPADPNMPGIYQIMVATTEPAPPRVYATGAGVEIENVDESRRTWSSRTDFWMSVMALVAAIGWVCVIVYGLFVNWLYKFIKGVRSS